MSGQGGLTCVHVEAPDTSLYGLQKVCFPAVPNTQNTIGRCREKIVCDQANGEFADVRTCPSGPGQPPPPAGCVKNYCCSLLALDTVSAPGKACALTDGFSDFAYAEFVDADGDNTKDIVDNCKTVPNFSQIDSDGDGIGSACDNCPTFPNQAQLDFDGDSIGNECDATPGSAPGLATSAPATPGRWFWLLAAALGACTARLARRRVLRGAAC
jgi:Thrombospondin type 3 repeat